MEWNASTVARWYLSRRLDDGWFRWMVKTKREGENKRKGTYQLSKRSTGLKTNEVKIEGLKKRASGLNKRSSRYREEVEGVMKTGLDRQTEAARGPRLLIIAYTCQIRLQPHPAV